MGALESARFPAAERSRREQQSEVGREIPRTFEELRGFGEQAVLDLENFRGDAISRFDDEDTQVDLMIERDTDAKSVNDDLEMDIQIDDIESQFAAAAELAEEEIDVVLEEEPKTAEAGEAAETAYELTPEDYREYVSENVERVLGSRPDFTELELLMDFAARDREAAGNFTEKLSTALGRDLAIQLLESGPEYRAGLARLQRSLETRIGGDPDDKKSGAVLLKKADLKTLMMLEGVVGTEPHRLAEAYDISGLSGEKLLYLPDVEILGTAELERGVVNFLLQYLDERGENTASMARSIQKVKERDGSTRLIVDYDFLELPEDLQGTQIGKEVLRKSLKEYDRIGVEEIKMLADIDVGSYAWAKYGFQWDLDKFEGDRAGAEKQVNTTIKFVKENVGMKLGEVGATEDELDAVLQEYDELLAAPFEEKTPQALAALGKGFEVAIDPDTNRLYRGDDAKVAGKRFRHDAVGKRGMFGVGWQAKLSLKPDAYGNKPPARKMLEAYLARK